MPLPTSKSKNPSAKKKDDSLSIREVSLLQGDKKFKELSNFIGKFNKAEHTTVETFNEMDRNHYQLIGVPMIDWGFFRCGIKRPTKILFYGPSHIGKTSITNLICSKFMDRIPDSTVLFENFDRVVDHDHMEKAYRICKEKGDRFIFATAQSIQHALEMTEEAYISKIFDIIVMDPWNMTALWDDVNKSGLKLIGQTKFADRAGANTDWFRTKSHLMEESGAIQIFSEHETVSKTGTRGFAGGEAFRGSMDAIFNMSYHFSNAPIPMLEGDTEKYRSLTRVEFLVKKQKLNDNTGARYVMYHKRGEGFLNDFNYLAWLEHHNVVVRSGSYYYLNAPGFGDGRKFYFKRWEDFFNSNKPEIMKLCESFAPSFKPIEEDGNDS